MRKNYTIYLPSSNKSFASFSSQNLLIFVGEQFQSHLKEVLAGLQDLHEVLRVNADVWVEHVKPFSQVLLHGVEVLVRPAEAAQLPLLNQVQGQLLLLGQVHQQLPRQSRQLSFPRIYLRHLPGC